MRDGSTSTDIGRRPSARGPARAATVADVMVGPVVTAGPGTLVAGARGLLARHSIRHLPVLADGLLVGIVSERDVLRAPSDTLPLREIMTPTVFVLAPETPIREAARLFRDRRFGALPVLDGRRLVGMLSVTDVLRLPAEQPRP